MRFPEYHLSRTVCQAGLGALRPLFATARADDPDGWNYCSGWPPSYRAYGRMRALLTLLTARSLRPRRVLEVAAGDAALCATLLPGNMLAVDPARVGRFDLIVAGEVLEHVAHPVALLRHLKNLLTADGRILITTPNGAYFRNRLPTCAQIKDFTQLEAQQFKPDADGQLFLVTPAELRQIAAAAGLRLAQIELWGTPVMTGRGGLRVCSGRVVARACFTLERFAQRWPACAKTKLCYALFATLSN